MIYFFDPTEISPPLLHIKQYPNITFTYIAHKSLKYYCMVARDSKQWYCMGVKMTKFQKVLKTTTFLSEMAFNLVLSMRSMSLHKGWELVYSFVC